MLLGVSFLQHSRGGKTLGRPENGGSPQKVPKIDKGRDFRYAPFAFNSSKRMNLSLNTVEWHPSQEIYVSKKYFGFSFPFGSTVSLLGSRLPGFPK